MAFMKMLQKKYAFIFKNRDKNNIVIDDEDFLATGQVSPKPFPSHLTFDSVGKPID